MVADRPMHADDERGEERDRLDTPIGRVEFARTQEIVLRHLPSPPADTMTRMLDDRATINEY